MNPENQQPIQPAQPIQPQPVQPIQPIQPAPLPPLGAAPQPVAPIQPGISSQPIAGMQPATSANLEKQKKLAFVLAIASIIIFVIALLFGYVLAGAAILGAYAVSVGIRVKSKSIIIIGAIGTVLNLGFYIASFFVK